MTAHDASMTPEQLKKAKVKHILKVTAILFIVTCIEFVLAFAWPDGADRSMLNFLFIALTLVKAFYIVAEFMHMKHESKSLQAIFLFPIVFLVWLLVALFKEGSAVMEAIQNLF